METRRHTGAGLTHISELIPPTQGHQPGASTDRQVEVTRLYHPDGTLQGERFRVRHRVGAAPSRSGGQEAGCLALLWLAGSAWGAGYAGGAIMGGGLGVAIGLGVWAAFVWCWM